MAVNVWQSLVEKWAADGTLNGLLSSTLVSIGRTEDPIQENESDRGSGIPYATIITVDDNPESRTSKGIFSQERIQISCFHETHASARAVQKAWRAVFDDRSLQLTLDDGRFVSFLRESGGRVVESEGVHHALDIYVLTKSS